MKKTLFSLFLCIVTLSMAGQSLAQGDRQPVDYTNTRFNFTLKLPPWFYAIRQADNGDGIIITDPTTLEILAYGKHIVASEESFEEVVKTWSKYVGTVKEEQIKKDENYFILKGVKELPADSEHAEQTTAIKVLYSALEHKILIITYYGESNKNYPAIIDAALASFNHVK